MTGRRWAGVTLLAAVIMLPAGGTAVQAAGEAPSFKHRPMSEKIFADAVGRAVVTAAHGTAKRIGLDDYKITEPKANRKELHIKMHYAGALSGAVSNKRYTANIVVKVDSTDKDAWEALNIDYKDDNNVPYNEKKVQGLIKEFNR